MADLVNTGERLDSQSKWMEQYQKGIDLGTWNANKLMQKVGFEDDIETWESLEEDERAEVARLVAFFMDAEQEVADDARHLLGVVQSPYLDDNLEKEMFYATLAEEEAKHTQFFSAWITHVAEDAYPGGLGGDVSHTRQSGGHRLANLPQGYHDVLDRQNRQVRTAADTGEPNDVARAITTYNGDVEGVTARASYFARNKMMKEAPLPLLSKAFQFISTDEGRHITTGLTLLKELVEKEKAGEDPAYDGVQRTILQTARENLYGAGEVLFNSIEATGDPLGVEMETICARAKELHEQQYRDYLDLDCWDDEEWEDHWEDVLEHAGNKDYEADLRQKEQSFMKRQGKTASDGGQ